MRPYFVYFKKNFRLNPVVLLLHLSLCLLFSFMAVYFTKPFVEQNSFYGQSGYSYAEKFSLVTEKTNDIYYFCDGEQPIFLAYDENDSSFHRQISAQFYKQYEGSENIYLPKLDQKSVSLSQNLAKIHGIKVGSSLYLRYQNSCISLMVKNILPVSYGLAQPDFSKSQGLIILSSDVPLAGNYSFISLRNEAAIKNSGTLLSIRKESSLNGFYVLLMDIAWAVLCSLMMIVYDYRLSKKKGDFMRLSLGGASYNDLWKLSFACDISTFGLIAFIAPFPFMFLTVNWNFVILEVLLLSAVVLHSLIWTKGTYAHQNH